MQMKIFLTAISFFLLLSVYGQRGYTEVTAKKGEVEIESNVKQFNIIKIGSSIQAEPFVDRYYDYYDPYYYDYYYYDEGGPCTQVFVSFEHIWEYKRSMAFSVEPMVGVSFLNSSTGFTAGSEFKFYWANRENWRMGVAIYSGYTYSNRETHRWISMDDGAYQKRVPLTIHYHTVSFGPALIPFQIRIKNSPVIIESMISLMGINVVTDVTDEYPVGDGEYQQIKGSEVNPYFLKFEMKVGFVLP